MQIEVILKFEEMCLQSAKEYSTLFMQVTWFCINIEFGVLSLHKYIGLLSRRHIKKIEMAFSQIFHFDILMLNAYTSFFLSWIMVHSF